MTAESTVSWFGPNLSFWITTVIVIVSAVAATVSRSIVQAVYCLFFTLFGMAGYYVLLGSGFLAITQVIIYVGGILVLLMFGILLTMRPMRRLDADFGTRLWLGFAIGALLLGIFGYVIVDAGWEPPTALAVPTSSVRQLGILLLSRYLPALEAAAMLLLLCLIGAAYLVRREER